MNSTEELARLVATLHADCGPTLALLVARSYRIDGKGRCQDGACIPLVEDLVIDEAEPLLLRRDADLYPCKERCDLVVEGHAWNPDRERSFACGIRSGAAGVILRAFGERQVERLADGSLRFAEAEPLEKIPLHAGSAYGGSDAAAEVRWGNPLAPLLPQLSPGLRDAAAALPHHASPRNPAGCGWLIDAADPAAIAALRLPLLEDADAPLSPATLAIGEQGRWPRTALAAHLGWVDHGSFPRCLHLGVLPEHDGTIPPEEWPEVAAGLLRTDDLAARPLAEQDARWCQGAVAPLQLALRGNETISLYHCKRGVATWDLQLPGERPAVRIARSDGKPDKAEAWLQTVVIRPDEERVDLVWSCRVAARRAYTAEQLAQVGWDLRW